nr:ATP-binding protein [Stenotrophomonas geniculata]
MPIERIVIENFKSFRYLNLELNAHMNLVVGDNEVGKSTLLEAIHAVVTGQLHGRNLAYELTPFLFHQPSVQEYFEALTARRIVSPPRISIEAYLGGDAALASLRGTNNSLRRRRRYESTGPAAGRRRPRCSLGLRTLSLQQLLPL